MCNGFVQIVLYSSMLLLAQPFLLPLWHVLIKIQRAVFVDHKTDVKLEEEICKKQLR